jgi:glucose-6-phosphate dehydrogenase assembly protein OpcA
VTGVVDSVWTARHTRPSEVEEALSRLLVERQAGHPGYATARALNMICVVDRRWSGEIANRLRHVGRYHASRTIVCAVDPGRTAIDARAIVASDPSPVDGVVTLLRETVILQIGPHHLEALDSICDPLVVSDVPTLLWTPHGHFDEARSVLPLVQTVLLDSVDEPELRAALDRARDILRTANVVDLAWLRSTPWRERVAATFDPPRVRRDLQAISAVTVRHHIRSVSVALLLVGWLASRLGWRVSPMVRHGDALLGRAHARRQDVRLTVQRVRELQVRGLDGLTLETANGRWLSLDRGPGGLQAHYRNAKGDERRWTVLGASRGEGGILGEGIRQALLCDPSYAPALAVADTLVGGP